MKSTNISNRFFLLLLPFLLTGCYTQFQTTDKFPLEKDRYNDYYAWDDFDDRRSIQDGAGQESSYQTEEEAYLDEEYALEEAGIYYKNYEVEQWYKDHYADRYYWEGYDDGFDDGYYKGYRNAYRDSYVYGYTPWEFNSWWYRHHRYMNRHNIWLGFHFGGPSYAYIGSSWYAHYPSYYGYGYYSYPFYSGWGYHWSYPYYNNVYVYNNYYRSQKYNRDADLYRKGPRSSGLVNRSDARTRSNLKGNNTTVRTRGVSTGMTRSRSTGNTSRVRGTGSSVGRSSSGTVNRGTRTRGNTNVGKGRTSGGNSRGSGSSVGKSRGSGGNNSSGNTRSRGSGTDISSRSSFLNNGAARVSKERTYTIPSTRVKTDRTNSSSRSRITIGDIFNSNSSSFTRTNRVNFSKSSSGVSSSRSANRSVINRAAKSIIRSSSSSIISRSSSSSTKSRSSSSSSSNKRSRGNN